MKMVKITKVKRGMNAGERCVPEEVEVADRFDEDTEPYEWVEITTKPMSQILEEYDCYFDRYGNLVSEHGHLAPSHFPDLGHTFHVAKGCGFDTDSDWLRNK